MQENALHVNRAALETAIIKKIRKMRGYDLALVASAMFDVDCKRVGKSNKQFTVGEVRNVCPASIILR